MARAFCASVTLTTGLWHAESARAASSGRKGRSRFMRVSTGLLVGGEMLGGPAAAERLVDLDRAPGGLHLGGGQLRAGRAPRLFGAERGLQVGEPAVVAKLGGVVAARGAGLAVGQQHHSPAVGV